MAGKAEVAYGFFVGLGVMIAIMIWGLVSMLTRGALGRASGG